ncbi:hypothetical protein EWM64_g9157 [Hericium alpestre]|uniref:Uncharacterized protein n=1 Tax=Hericium alpestre TaxID=135208 RepID=A0A4Y9ZJT6_9AGAM|nr:hypothetical protein EWM64_g9157 [Hericium alpestre]
MQLADVLTVYSSSEDYDDLLFTSILGTAFHGLMHLGELIWLDHHALQDWQRIIREICKCYIAL